MQAIAEVSFSSSLKQNDSKMENLIRTFCAKILFYKQSCQKASGEVLHIPSFMNLHLIPSARGPREVESSNLNLTLSAHFVNQCFATDKQKGQLHNTIQM